MNKTEPTCKPIATTTRTMNSMMRQKGRLQPITQPNMADRTSSPPATISKMHTIKLTSANSYASKACGKPTTMAGKATMAKPRKKQTMLNNVSKTLQTDVQLQAAIIRLFWSGLAADVHSRHTLQHYSHKLCCRLNCGGKSAVVVSVVCSGVIDGKNLPRPGSCALSCTSGLLCHALFSFHHIRHTLGKRLAESASHEREAVRCLSKPGFRIILTSHSLGFFSLIVSPLHFHQVLFFFSQWYWSL